MNSLITIGNYKKSGYVFVNGTRTITIYGIDFPLDFSKIKKFANQTQNIYYGVFSSWKGNSIGQILPSAPTAGTPTAGGSVNAGTHQYKVSFVYIDGSETLTSEASNQITTVVGSLTVPLSNIPLGNSKVIARKIYRTAANSSTYLYLTTINNNTGTTYNDISSDASLTYNEPSVSYVYDITLANTEAVLVSNDVLTIEVEVSNSNEDDDLGVTKTINLNEPDLQASDPEVGIVNDTNIAANIYYYQIPLGYYKHLVAQGKLTAATSVSKLKIFATLDPNATVPSTGTAFPSVDWVDITEAIYDMKEISIPIIGTTILQIKDWCVDRAKNHCKYDSFLVMYTVGNATGNLINFNILKY